MIDPYLYSEDYWQYVGGITVAAGIIMLVGQQISYRLKQKP